MKLGAIIKAMGVWRRISAIVLAVAMGVSPTLACTNFCPQSDTGLAQAADRSVADADHSIAAAAAMPKDCADAMNALANDRPQSRSHDPDCQGCSDCPAIANVKNPALAFASAVFVEAPTVISLDLAIAPVVNVSLLTRHRLTPPANGPPLVATPVILKDILRI